MAITKVSIEEGCIGCGVCVAQAPEVFEMAGDNLAVAKAGADLEANEAKLKEAAESCPVNVIKYA